MTSPDDPNGGNYVESQDDFETLLWDEGTEPTSDIAVPEYLSPDYDPDAPVTEDNYNVVQIVNTEIIVDPLDEGAPPDLDPVPDDSLEPTPEPPTAEAQPLPPLVPNSTLYYNDQVYHDPIVQEYDPLIGPTPPPLAPDPAPDEYEGYIPTLNNAVYIVDDRLSLPASFTGDQPVAGPLGISSSGISPRAIVGFEGDESNVTSISQQPWVWLAADQVTGAVDGAEVTSAPLRGTSGATAITDADDPENAWRGPIYRATGLGGKPALDFRPDYAADEDARRLFVQTTGDANAAGHFTVFAVAQLPSATATDGLQYNLVELRQTTTNNLLRLTMSHDLDTATARITATVNDTTRGNVGIIEHARTGSSGEDLQPVLATLSTAETGLAIDWAPDSTHAFSEYTDALNNTLSTPLPLGPLNFDTGAQLLDIGRAFQGLISEVIVFRGDHALSDHERWQVRSYLSQKYGDISIEVQPTAPPARNQVANPSGEINKIGTWQAANGSVTMAVNQATAGPLFGTKHVTYTVATAAGDGFYVSYHAPMAEPYFGAFLIGPSRQAGSSVYVSAPQTVGVTLYAEFLALVGRQFYRVGVSPMGNKLMLPAAGSWQRLQASMPAPEGATHYYIRVAVSGSVEDPTPQIGTQLWLEGAMVTDDGNVAGIKYVDGAQFDGEWEGQAHNSSSVRGLDLRPILYVPEVRPAMDDQDEDPDVFGPDPMATEEYGASPVPPLPPTPPVYRPTKPEDVLSEAGVRVGQLCLSGDVAIGELILNQQDQYGNVWVLTDMEGWWNLPDPEVPEITRGWDDGEYETRGRYKSRVFNISGLFVPKSPSQVASARDRLLRAIDLCHAGDWVRTREGKLVKGSKVWLSGRPEITTNKLSGKTFFSIGVRAPDPIKYELVGGRPPGYRSTTIAPVNHRLPGREYDRRRSGEVWNSGERLWRREYGFAYPEAFLGPSDISLNNIGNTPTAPVLRLQGPTYGKVSIVNDTTKQIMQVVRPLSQNETLEIDCVTRQVSLNNIRNMRRYLSTFTDWLRLAPGPNDVYFYDELGTEAKLEIRWQSGWIG